ncbi:hypothetical protein, partial [Pseudonocardia sp. N23]|uniref:hypothetical protein n=1 Tax=Pseudonocardia sp. N23 TaxID=1987376 RepID=UPI001559B6A6
MIAFASAVRALMDIPGATCACVLDGDSGEVFGAISHGMGDDVDTSVVATLAAAGMRLSGVPGHDGDDPVDDVTVTSRRSFHVLRPVDVGGRRVIVYLRLQRGRSNLAVARRALAAPEVTSAVAALVDLTAASRPPARVGVPQAVADHVPDRTPDRAAPSPYPRQVTSIPLQSNGYRPDSREGPRAGGSASRPSPPAAMAGRATVEAPRGAGAMGRPGEPVRADTAERADHGGGRSPAAAAPAGAGEIPAV